MIKVITHESEDEYHSRSRNGEFISSHLLALYRRSPYKYHETVTGNWSEPDRAEFAFGRAAHKLILEGEAAFEEAYTVADGPVNPKTGAPYGKATQAYQSWLSEQRGEVLATADFEEIKKMRQSCYNHRGIAELLHWEGAAEGVVRHGLYGVPCQIRMDWWSPEAGIVDLKTCRDIEFFEKDCRDFGYAYQLAFYRKVLEAATGIRYPVHIIAVDKTDFHIAGRWDIPDCELEEAEGVNKAALLRLKESRENESWPTGYEETRIFTLHREY